jgi:hypothetical protein
MQVHSLQPSPAARISPSVHVGGQAMSVQAQVPSAVQLHSLQPSKDVTAPGVHSTPHSISVQDHSPFMHQHVLQSSADGRVSPSVQVVAQPPLSHDQPISVQTHSVQPSACVTCSPITSHSAPGSGSSPPTLESLE